MSVRGLVTVVIGVGRNRLGTPAKQFAGNQTPLSQGNLSHNMWYGNLELAGATCSGQVQRLYTGNPYGIKRKSVPLGNHRGTRVAFVVIDSLKMIGALWGNSRMKNSLSQGNLSAVAYGNPELARASCFGQVQRLYTSCPFNGEDKEKVRTVGKPALHKVSRISSRALTPAALIQWRCRNLPNSGNPKLYN